MDIAVTPFDVESIEKLSNIGADTFIIGNENFANRLVKSFSLLDITKASEIIKKLHKKMNAIRIYINLHESKI